jgi:glucose/arabinose dehydrogenase
VLRSILAVAVGLVLNCGGAAAQEIPLDTITLPPGFSIAVYASGVANARSMALSASGTLFVSTRQAGDVYAVVDRDQDQVVDEVITIASGLNTPNGVAIRDGALFVAELNRILRYDDIEVRLQDQPEPVVVYDELPSERMHGWKFIRFGPDGKLYVPVGAPCSAVSPRLVTVLMSPRVVDA